MKKFLIGFLLGVFLATTGLALAGQNIKLIVDGREIQCDVPPQEINGRVLVPARFLAEALGAKVEWDAVNNAVVVTKNQDDRVIINTKPLKEVSKLPSPGMINIQTDKQLIRDAQEEIIIDGEIYVLIRNAFVAITDLKDKPFVARQLGPDGENSITIDDKKFDLPQIGAKEIDGRIYVPLSPLQNAGVLRYSWDNDTKTLIITR